MQTNKITDVRTIVVNAQMRNWVFVKVETDQPGLYGWGEATLEWKTNAVVGCVEDFKPLLLGAVMVACTNLLFAWLATIGPDVNILVITISADSLSAGLAGSSFIAYLSSLVNKAYTATQYALFSSLFTLPGKLLGGLSGIVVDTAGYVTFFIYASVLGLPAILLVIYFLQRERNGRAREGYAA